jgi:hypothetical protein
MCVNNRRTALYLLIRHVCDLVYLANPPLLPAKAKRTAVQRDEEPATSTAPAASSVASSVAGWRWRRAGACFEDTDAGALAARDLPAGVSGALLEANRATSSVEPTKRDPAAFLFFELAGASGVKREGEGATSSSASEGERVCASSASYKRESASRLSFESAVSTRELAVESWSRNDDTMLCRTAYCAKQV